MRDIRQTREYAHYLSQTGWIVENLDGVFVYIKKIPLLGSIIKIQRSEKLNFELIDEVALNYKARRIIIEPKNDNHTKELLQNGYKHSKSPFLPTKTLILDLTKSEKFIFDNFKSDSKSAIKKSAQIIITETTPSQFYTHWKKHTKSRFLLSSQKELEALQKSFGKNCIFLITENFSSGAIFLKADNTVYYWKAFTSPKGRDEKAQYRLVWEGILWAKQKKAQCFDFEGIYDERFPLKAWRGFSHFKKSFNGTIVEYPGTYVKNKLF